MCIGSMGTGQIITGKQQIPKGDKQPWITTITLQTATDSL